MNNKEATELLQNMRKIPYPKLDGVRMNIPFANQLYGAYTNQDGEFTATNMYVYQHIAVADVELGKTLLEIAKVEMHHLDIIGTILKRLGVYPYYRDSKGHFWNAANGYYQVNDIREMLEYNIRSEKGAIKEYTSLKQLTYNISIRKTIERIIMDETLHLEIFEGYLKNYTK